MNNKHFDENSIVGEKFTNYKGEEFIITSFSHKKSDNKHTQYYYNVRFTKTGHERILSKSHIIHGIGVDNSKAITKTVDNNIVGKNFMNNKGLEFKVLYRDDKNGLYVVKFLKTGYIKKNCTKVSIKSGLIKDKIDDDQKILNNIYTNDRGESYKIIKIYKNITPSGKTQYKCKIKFLKSGNEYDVFKNNAIKEECADKLSRKVGK